MAATMWCRRLTQPLLGSSREEVGCPPLAVLASRRAARRGSMGRSRRGRVASSGGASSVVGESARMTEKRNLYLYLYLYL